MIDLIWFYLIDFSYYGLCFPASLHDLDAGHCEFYLVGCRIFLYFSVILWDIVKLFGRGLGLSCLAFKLS